MDMDILNFGTYDIIHKGKKVFYDWKMYKEHEQIWIKYNGENIVLNLRKNVHEWNDLCLLMCSKMDTLSKEDFKVFKENFDEVEMSKLFNK